MKINNSNIIVLDNGGTTLDRYTIVYLDTLERGVYYARGCCENPSAPNGVGCSVEITESFLAETEETRLTIEQVPKNLMVLIEADLVDLCKKVEIPLAMLEALYYNLTDLTTNDNCYNDELDNNHPDHCFSFEEIYSIIEEAQND
ncbi:MAG: hypothetical protein GY804_03905 [Alphaproteobacteria bacterium]|nr:hypothetical protein [Alphaproteobacteria bacterium]